MKQYIRPKENAYLNFSTCFDMFGEEFFIYESKLNKIEGINIELFYGRPVERPRDGTKLIITKELEERIKSNETLHASKFGDYLTDPMIRSIRRKFKKNPYKNYEAWRDSKDENKLKEVYFLNRKNKLEFLTDYFGTVFVLTSARIAKNNISLPMGIPKDIYFLKSPRSREYIITKEIAEYIRAHKYHPLWGREALSCTPKVIAVMRKKLGYGYAKDDVHAWVAAHITEIFSMTNEAFIERYIKNKGLGKGTIISPIKTAMNTLARYKKSHIKKEKEIFALVQSLEKVSSPVVNKKLTVYMGEAKARYFTKAYKILMMARDYKYDIPKNIRAVLKKRYL